MSVTLYWEEPTGPKPPPKKIRSIYGVEIGSQWRHRDRKMYYEVIEFFKSADGAYNVVLKTPHAPCYAEEEVLALRTNGLWTAEGGDTGIPFPELDAMKLFPEVGEVYDDDLDNRSGPFKIVEVYPTESWVLTENLRGGARVKLSFGYLDQYCKKRCPEEVAKEQAEIRDRIMNPHNYRERDLAL